MAGDLISFAADDDDDDNKNNVVVSPSGMNSSPAPKASTFPVHHDGFSELTSLMRARKPYTVTPSPTPKPPPSSPPLLDPAPNVSHVASRVHSTASILSQLAKPFLMPESVADFLHKQELASPAALPCESFPDHDPEKMIQFEKMANAVLNYDSDDDSGSRIKSTPPPPPPPDKGPLLSPGLTPPVQAGPIKPPNPADSLQTSPLGYRSAYEPTVGPAELVELKEENRRLRRQLLDVEKKSKTILEGDHIIASRLGLPKHQNEANREQKGSMGRALAQKEMEIKTQQLEIDYLTQKLADSEAELRKRERVSGEFDNFRCTLKQTTRERDEAVQAQANAGYHQTRAQDLVETLTKCEKKATELREKLMEERLRVIELKDQIEHLKQLSNKTELEELRSELGDKTSMCDRQRNQIKVAEAQFQQSQERLLRITQNGQSLQGAAHLVKPSANAKLPKTVVACSECYAQNLTCDNSAKCCSCDERNVSCARWRCSLKHRLGDCPLTPCKLPHDSQGWLVLQTERPQW